MEYVIAHHGIKGQKWGVRRYQNSDGSLTEAGRERYERKTKEALKKVAIGVGVASAVAAGVYFTRQYMQKYGEVTLPHGTEFQHMSRYTDEVLNKPFYASYLKKDNKTYLKNEVTGGRWNAQMKFKVNTDVRIPSNRHAEKMYTEWAKAVSQDSQHNGTKIPSSYYTFVANLTSPDMEFTKMRDDFYGKLKAEGYSAIRDLNDQAQSITKSPIIFFGNYGDILVTDIIQVANAKNSVG